MAEISLPAGALEPDELLMVRPVDALKDPSLSDRHLSVAFSTAAAFVLHAEGCGFDMESLIAADPEASAYPNPWAIEKIIRSNADLQNLQQEWQRQNELRGARALLGHRAVRRHMYNVESAHITGTGLQDHMRETVYRGPLVGVLKKPELQDWMDYRLYFKYVQQSILVGTSYAAAIYGTDFVGIEPLSRTRIRRNGSSKTVWEISIRTGVEGLVKMASRKPSAEFMGMGLLPEDDV